MEGGYVVCVLTVLVYSSSCFGQGTCVKKNDCVCQFSDGTTINLESLGKKGSFAFPYQKDTSGASDFEYAYNPCYPVTDTDDCKDVAACQRNPSSNDHYSIGDATSAHFLGSDDKIVLAYSSVDKQGKDKTLSVNLVCDKTATTPQYVVQGEEPQGNAYQYTLTSECCCPGGCGGGTGSPPPPPGSHQTNVTVGLSLGSILCITFSSLVVVYLITGVIFMKYVKHAEGKEVIPNYSFWTDLPSLIKGGFKFTYSKFLRLIGKEGYDSI